MAQEKMQPKGSWPLRILIVVLVVFLLASILYPKKLWEEQAVLTEDCRERMENLNLVVQRYHQVRGGYSADLDSLVSFIKSDSIQVKRALFEFEKLSLYDAPYDSFLIGFVDLYHFDRLEFQGYRDGAPLPVVEATDTNTALPDSVVISMVPKEVFADVIEPVKVAMTCERDSAGNPLGVEYYKRGKGLHDIYWMVWSKGHLARHDLEYAEKTVPSAEYLLYRDVDDITIDPISGERFRLGLNAKVGLEGKITYVLLVKGEPDSAVSGNELITNLLINKLARRARSKLDEALKRDTTLFAQQLELQSDFFDVELTMIRPKRPITVEGDKEVTVPVDSVDAYRDELRIKRELFTAKYDSLIRVWTSWEKTQDLLRRMNYTEEYSVTKVDTIGVTIRPPFDTSFPLPPKNLLDRIFSVGPIASPGNVENNDLSWSEKK